MVRQIAITQRQNQRAANHVKSELEYASDLDEWRIKNLLALVSLSHERQELDFQKIRLSGLITETIQNRIEMLKQELVELGVEIEDLEDE